MKLSTQNIAFKAIIPKFKTQVLNKKSKKFEQVTFCEVDCKNKNDYKIFSKLAKTWDFGACLKQSAQWKYENFTAGRDDRRNHYILRKKNGEIIAICRTSNTPDNIQIDFLESKPNSKYRFAGQMIISSIIKEAFKKNCNEIVIPAALNGTDDFYMGACGFRKVGKKSETKVDFIMGEKEMMNLVQNAPIQR